MLHIDFETFCEINVKTVGAHVYSRHPSCEVLMMGYTFGSDPIELWVPDGLNEYHTFPDSIRSYIKDGGEVCAHNVEFEENIFRNVLGIDIPIDQLRDTGVLALTHGYPMSLKGAALAIGLEQKKDTRGDALIRKFCQPRKPTKHNKLPRWDQYSASEDWQDFCDYCIQDVEVERMIWNALAPE